MYKSIGIQDAQELQEPKDSKKKPKLKGLQRLTGLRGFWYYDVPNKSDEEGVPSIICQVPAEKEPTPANSKLDYDVGIFSLKTEAIAGCFQAANESDRVLSGTAESYVHAKNKFDKIGNLANSKKQRGKTYGYIPHQGKPKHGDNALAIGMVLALIAKKGSAENGNSQPYLMMVQRQNAKLRNDELDAAVVEGFNDSDFKKIGGSTTSRYADLNQVARRALEEERGLNYDMLEKLGLLYMPKKYYFGYDDQYQQWNFFGTVVVDCTIEELIREGFYFTKDKFESKGILGIPLDPQILYYHLSREKLDSDTGEISIEMWKHGWASLLFAVRDYFGIKKTSYAERVCLHLSQGKYHHVVWRGVRECINRVAASVMPRNNGINILCAGLSALLLLMTVFYFENPETWGNPITLISTAITVITCWCVVALARDNVVSRKDIFFIETNQGTSARLLETRVFQNIVLVDGNIGDAPNISFGIKKIDGDAPKSPIFVGRQDQTENPCWKFIDKDKPYDAEDQLRFIFPLIADGKNIVLRTDGKGFSHQFDFYVPYETLKEKVSDQEIKKLIWEQIAGIGGVVSFHNLMLSDEKLNEALQLHFLLKESVNSESGLDSLVVVGFINCKQEELGANCKCRSLSYDLTNTSFALNFKDDATRVACEYAVAKYVGYKMESR